MGLWGTIKGVLNIGGVSVKVEGLSQVIPKDGNKINAKVILTSKEPKTVTKLIYKFYLQKTSGTGDKQKTEEFVVSQKAVPGPFEIAAGETKTFDLDLDYALAKTLKDMGGVLGGVGKFAAFASGEKEEYYITVIAEVKGTALSPSKTIPVTVK
jgi:hypothetical protein